MNCEAIDENGEICGQPCVIRTPFCVDHKQKYLDYLDFCEDARQVKLDPWTWLKEMKGRFSAKV